MTEELGNILWSYNRAKCVRKKIHFYSYLHSQISSSNISMLSVVCITFLWEKQTRQMRKRNQSIIIRRFVNISYRLLMLPIKTCTFCPTKKEKKELLCNRECKSHYKGILLYFIMLFSRLNKKNDKLCTWKRRILSSGRERCMSFFVKFKDAQGNSFPTWFTYTFILW